MEKFKFQNRSEIGKIGSIEVFSHPNFTKHGKMSPTQFLHFLINLEKNIFEYPGSPGTENFNCAFFEKKSLQSAQVRAPWFQKHLNMFESVFEVISNHMIHRISLEDFPKTKKYNITKVRCQERNKRPFLSKPTKKFEKEWPFHARS